MVRLAEITTQEIYFGKLTHGFSFVTARWKIWGNYILRCFFRFQVFALELCDYRFPTVRVNDGDERGTEKPTAQPFARLGASPSGLQRTLRIERSGENSPKDFIQTKCSIHGCFAYSHLTVLNVLTTVQS